MTKSPEDIKISPNCGRVDLMGHSHASDDLAANGYVIYPCEAQPGCSGERREPNRAR